MPESWRAPGVPVAGQEDVKLRARGHVQLLEDVRQVRLDRAPGDVQQQVDALGELEVLLSEPSRAGDVIERAAM